MRNPKHLRKLDRVALDAASAVLVPLGFLCSVEQGGKHPLILAERDGERFGLTYAGTPRTDEAVTAAWVRRKARQVAAGTYERLPAEWASQV